MPLTRNKRAQSFRNILLERVKPHFFFDENRRCFKLNRMNGKPKTVKGLVPSLRKVFYDQYNYLKANTKTGKRRKKKVRREEEEDEEDVVKDVYGGTVRGTIVHKQLAMLAENCSLEEFQSQFIAVHPYTIKGFKFLKEMGLTPIAAEVPIGDPNMMVGTAIDMICLDPNERVVLIEWKTGMDESFTKGDKNMDGPALLNNCPMNQACLQLLFGKMMLERNYGLRSSIDLVVHIRKDGVKPIPIPENILAQKTRLYEYFESIISS